MHQMEIGQKLVAGGGEVPIRNRAVTVTARSGIGARLSTLKTGNRRVTTER